MKCLPASKLSTANGDILHDWHAETIAIRAFNRFLIDECHDLATSKIKRSDIIVKSEDYERAGSRPVPPFNIRDNLRILMYTSEVPCGDASMGLVMEAQDDASPWPVITGSKSDGPESLLGRGSFSQLGVVRRKPGKRCLVDSSNSSSLILPSARGDGPLALSKSCSDKLALKQCVSLLSGPVSLLVSPKNAYLHTLIVPADRYRREACDRAFSEHGRMHAIVGDRLGDDYYFRPFEVRTTDLVFEFSRTLEGSSSQAKSSNIMAIWTPSCQETLINGVRAGWKQIDPQGRSTLSRKEMWRAVSRVLSCTSSPILQNLTPTASYQQLKHVDALIVREKVKSNARTRALKGWICSDADDFQLGPSEV